MTVNTEKALNGLNSTEFYRILQTSLFAHVLKIDDIFALMES